MVMTDLSPEDTSRPGRERQRLRVAWLFWLAGLVLGVLVLILISDDGGGDGEGGPVAMQNVQVGEETEQALIQSASTPAIAVNPRDPRNYVMGYRIERPTFSCAVTASFDEGRSWDPGALALPPGAERCYTTSLAFDRDGSVHVVFATLAGPNNVPVGAWHSRSADGGKTFTSPAQVLGPGKYQVRLAVDSATSPPRLYLTWVEPQGFGLFSMAPPSSIMARVSTDGGASFGAPVRVSDARRDRVGAPVPVIGANSALHVLYYDYRRDIFDFQNEPGRYQGDFELVAATSRDGGATFSEATVDGGVRPPEPFLVFTPPFPSMAADPARGRLYAAWSDARAEKPAVLLAVSSDGGASWSAPRRVDDGAGEALLPQLSVAPEGRLDVAYASVRGGEGNPTEIRLTASDDQGKSFGPAIPLNRAFFRQLFPISARKDAGHDLGSALGMVSKDDGAYVAWPDTRRGGSDTLRVDIVGAPVRVESKGRTRPLMKLVG